MNAQQLDFVFEAFDEMDESLDGRRTTSLRDADLIIDDISSTVTLDNRSLQRSSSTRENVIGFSAEIS